MSGGVGLGGCSRTAAGGYQTRSWTALAADLASRRVQLGGGEAPTGEALAWSSPVARSMAGTLGAFTSSVDSTNRLVHSAICAS